MVQTKRAEINSDTAVSIAHHHRPGSRPQGGFLPSYDPKNEGAWDGQLPNPDLVDQRPPQQRKCVRTGTGLHHPRPPRRT